MQGLRNCYVSRVVRTPLLCLQSASLHSNIWYITTARFASHGNCKTWQRHWVGSVIGCKRFSCGGVAVWRLVMGLSLDAWYRGSRGDHGGGECGFVPGVCRSFDWAYPSSVVCREIACYMGPDGEYRAEEAGKAARAASAALRSASWIVMRSFAAA